MTKPGSAATAASTASFQPSPASASAATKKKCSSSPTNKGWSGDGAWLMCDCGWYVHGFPSMRKAKRQFTWHKQGLDPA